MAESLSALRERYAQPDLRAALEAHLAARLNNPPANVGPPPAPPGPQMPNINVQDFGRFKQTSPC
jgi:hypothetical protein